MTLHANWKIVAWLFHYPPFVYGKRPLFSTCFLSPFLTIQVFEGDGLSSQWRSSSTHSGTRTGNRNLKVLYFQWEQGAVQRKQIYKYLITDNSPHVTSGHWNLWKIYLRFNLMRVFMNEHRWTLLLKWFSHIFQLNIPFQDPQLTMNGQKLCNFVIINIMGWVYIFVVRNFYNDFKYLTQFENVYNVMSVFLIFLYFVRLLIGTQVLSIPYGITVFLIPFLRELCRPIT